MTYLKTFTAAAFALALSTGAAVAACGAASNAQFAAAIAHGHAYTKHAAEFVNGAVEAGLAFPDPTIANANDFAGFLEGILNAPTQNKALVNGRHGYWDATTGTIIITNANVNDCGTAFRPSAGVTYYNSQN